MDPYRNESMADLIVRKPGNLNILVTGLEGEPGTIALNGRIASQPRQWHAVRLRYGYTPVRLPDGDERPTAIGLPVLGERMDDAKRDRLGRPRAIAVIADVAGIEHAVATLKATWGDVPVQDKSGLVPHLATMARGA